MIIDMRKGSVGQTAGREKKKRGFTLTEIAIVLGIIGLILGAIWVAAAAVYNNLRTSKTTTELLQIAQAVRAVYATSTTTGDAAGTDETQNLCKAGVFPGDMVTNPCAAATPFATDVWGKAVTVTSQTVSVAGDSFGIEFTGVPQSSCVQVLTSNTGQGRDSGLYYAAGSAAAVGAAAYPAGPSAFPFTTATSAGLCTITGAAGNAIQFQFKLKG